MRRSCASASQRTATWSRRRARRRCDQHLLRDPRGCAEVAPGGPPRCPAGGPRLRDGLRGEPRRERFDGLPDERHGCLGAERASGRSSSLATSAPLGCVDARSGSTACGLSSRFRTAAASRAVSASSRRCAALPAAARRTRCSPRFDSASSRGTVKSSSPASTSAAIATAKRVSTSPSSSERPADAGPRASPPLVDRGQPPERRSRCGDARDAVRLPASARAAPVRRRQRPARDGPPLLGRDLPAASSRRRRAST